jgi:hypothetical protein
MQKCVSCLLGETGASIMGVQEPLASKGTKGDQVTFLQHWRQDRTARGVKGIREHIKAIS